jgi:hypothetical protein
MYDQQTPHAPIATEKLQWERKSFFLDLRENPRGRYLKITESVAGRRDTILMPVECLPEFIEALRRLSEFERNLPDLPV